MKQPIPGVEGGVQLACDGCGEHLGPETEDSPTGVELVVNIRFDVHMDIGDWHQSCLRAALVGGFECLVRRGKAAVTRALEQARHESVPETDEPPTMKGFCPQCELSLADHTEDNGSLVCPPLPPDTTQWKILPYTGADKVIQIVGPNNFYPGNPVVEVDYDDIDHDQQEAHARNIVGHMNGVLCHGAPAPRYKFSGIDHSLTPCSGEEGSAIDRLEKIHRAMLAGGEPTLGSTGRGIEVWAEEIRGVIDSVNEDPPPVPEAIEAAKKMARVADHYDDGRLDGKGDGESVVPVSLDDLRELRRLWLGKWTS